MPPTNDYVERLVTADMLVPIDHSLVPSMKNIDPNFLDADFDPGRKYSLPYMWGTIGIGYRKSKVDAVPDSRFGRNADGDGAERDPQPGAVRRGRAALTPINLLGGE